MDALRFYTISDRYVKYMQQFEKHIYNNIKGHSQNPHTYVGVLLNVNKLPYFAPLVSMKSKYLSAKDKLDMIMLKPYSVINLNNMMPVPLTEVACIDFSKQEPKYRSLLIKEWNLCRAKRNKIADYANRLYNGIVSGKLSMPQCFDYRYLEEKCQDFINKTE